MKRTPWIVVFVTLLGLILTACSVQNSPIADSVTTEGAGMMGNRGMMRFHMAEIPSPYNGMRSPIAFDEKSIARGQEIFVTNCATCHGDGGMGDGPAAAALDPSPAPIAHTSQMMSDGYLFWRITEGGGGFETAMISFKNTLSDDDRWDVINYIRALGSNVVMPVEQYGGMTNDPSIEATQQADMLSTGVAKGVISQNEADLFGDLHPIVDDFMMEHRGQISAEGKTMMESGLEELVTLGEISDEEAKEFLDIHNRLLEAGLMQ